MGPARETWVHPPLLGREAAPPWRAVLRYRLAVALLLLVLVAVFVLVYRQLSGANDQDPDLQGPAPGVTAPVLPGEG